MLHFWKHLGNTLIWLLLSEILCLILAFSFAILSARWVQYLGMACGIMANALLMANCGKKFASEDAIVYRTQHIRTSVCKPLLLGICAAIPAWCTYLFLNLQADSVLYLNLYLLMNAPYIQLNRLLLQGCEPFSAVPLWGKICMAIPPVVTGISLWTGYQLHYISAVAAQDAKHSHT